MKPWMPLFALICTAQMGIALSAHADAPEETAVAIARKYAPFLAALDVQRVFVAEECRTDSAEPCLLVLGVQSRAAVARLRAALPAGLSLDGTKTQFLALKTEWRPIGKLVEFSEIPDLRKARADCLASQQPLIHCFSQALQKYEEAMSPASAKPQEFAGSPEEAAKAWVAKYQPVFAQFDTGIVPPLMVWTDEAAGSFSIVFSYRGFGEEGPGADPIQQALLGVRAAPPGDTDRRPTLSLEGQTVRFDSSDNSIGTERGGGASVHN